MKPRVLWRNTPSRTVQRKLDWAFRGRNERFRAMWKSDVARQLTMESRKAWWKAERHDWRCQKVVTFLVFLHSLSIHEKCQPVSQTWCLQNFSATLKWTAWTTWTIQTTNESLFDKCFHHAFYQEDTYPPLRWPLESSRPEPLLVLNAPQVDSPPPSQVSQIQHARSSHRVYPHHEYRESMQDRNPALCEVSARARRTWSQPLEQSGLVRVWLLGYILHIEEIYIYKYNHAYIHIYIYIQISHIHMIFVPGYDLSPIACIYFQGFPATWFGQQKLHYKHIRNPRNHSCRPEPGYHGTSDHFSIPILECGWTHSEHPNPRATRSGAPERWEVHPENHGLQQKTHSGAFQLCRKGTYFPSKQKEIKLLRWLWM